MARKRVIYTGRVQGVGFRATTRSISRGHDVAGFVRNRPDGSVEVVAIGTDAEVDAFLAAVRETLGRLVESAAVTDDPGTEAFDGFEVQR